MTISQAFNKSAEYYDDWIKKALPCFNDIFLIATEVIPFPRDSKMRVLDLGAGTGLFSKFIYEKYPHAEFILYDVAENMLEIAKARFRNNIHQFQFIVGDYQYIREQRLGKFDLVISSLSIHHLEDANKKKLFKDSYEILNNSGVFLNLDQIKGETDYLQNLYWNNWLEKTRKNGGTAEQIQASIQRRKDYDKDASLFDQIQWLKEAGFSHIDCIYKNYFVGLFFCIK